MDELNEFEQVRRECNKCECFYLFLIEIMKILDNLKWTDLVEKFFCLLILIEDE